MSNFNFITDNVVRLLATALFGAGIHSYIDPAKGKILPSLTVSLLLTHRSRPRIRHRYRNSTECPVIPCSRCTQHFNSPRTARLEFPRPAARGWNDHCVLHNHKLDGSLAELAGERKLAPACCRECSACWFELLDVQQLIQDIVEDSRAIQAKRCDGADVASAPEL